MYFYFSIKIRFPSLLAIKSNCVNVRVSKRQLLRILGRLKTMAHNFKTKKKAVFQTVLQARAICCSASRCDSLHTRSLREVYRRRIPSQSHWAVQNSSIRQRPASISHAKSIRSSQTTHCTCQLGPQCSDT